MPLTALVELIEPDDVILAHLSSLAQLSIAIGNGNHGGVSVLGESSSNRASGKDAVRL